MRGRVDHSGLACALLGEPEITIGPAVIPVSCVEELNPVENSEMASVVGLIIPTKLDAPVEVLPIAVNQRLPSARG